jgi:methionine-rich copper-binding protein CopC
LNASNGKKQGQIVIDIPPLNAGDYALRFKVFAADGHLTEDVIHFSVTE